MTDSKNPKHGGDYEVGYGKPPKHTQFVPGQSGFKGRKKKFEGMGEMIARIRDEKVVVNGREITKFELVLQQVFNQTIKGGKPRDLKVLLDLLAQHNMIPEVDKAAESKAAADAVIDKIMDIFDRTHDIDPEDSAANERDNDAEALYVIECSRCGSFLKERWKDAGYKARVKRYGGTRLHEALLDARKRLIGK